MARRVEVQLVGDSRSLERAFDRAGRKGQEFERTMLGVRTSSIKTWAKAGAVGAAVGGAAILTRQLFKSVDAAKEEEVAQAKLRQAFKASGKSYKVHGKAVDLAIKKTSQLAGIDDELVSESFANLLRTSGSVSKAMKGIALAADIARARNISLDSAAKIVERTMNGQYLSLRRVGVQVDANMTSTQALEAAQRKFAGSAERYGKTTAGAQERLAVAYENVQEKIGKKLLPLQLKLAEALIRFIEWVERNWPKFQKAIDQMWSAVKPILEAFKTYLKGWMNIIGGIIEGDWGRVWKGVKQVVEGAFRGLFEWFKALPLRFFKWGVKMGEALARGILDGLKGIGKKILEAITPDLGNQSRRPGPGRRGTAAPRPVTPVPSEDQPPTRGFRPPPKKRALGGPVIAGESYLVGERGPEMFTPRMSGTIFPNGSGGGMSIGVVNVYGVQNAREFLSELQRIAGAGVSQSRGRFGGSNLVLN